MTPEHDHHVDPRHFVLAEDAVPTCHACQWLGWRHESGLLASDGHYHPRPFVDCDYCKAEGRVNEEKIAETFTAVECVLAFVRWHHRHVPNDSLTAADEFYTELAR